MTTKPQSTTEPKLEPIYVASRASITERGIMWRQLRAEGIPITSSWIDEDGEGETASFVELWDRIYKEIAAASALVLYAERDDFPLKGALIEAGIALGMGKPVIVCLPDLGVLLRNYRPVGSWIAHPLVSRRDEIRAAIELATRSRLFPASAAPVVDNGDMGRLYTEASVVVDDLSMKLSALRSENRLMRSVVDAAIAYTIEFKTGMTSEALQQLAVAVNAYVDGRADVHATDTVRATAKAAVEQLNTEGCWLLSDATPEELNQIAEIIAAHFSTAATAAPQQSGEIQTIIGPAPTTVGQEEVVSHVYGDRIVHETRKVQIEIPTPETSEAAKAHGLRRIARRHYHPETALTTAAPVEQSDEVTLRIPTCGKCPFVDHSGAFTPGGAKPICGHRDAPDTFAAGIVGDEHYHWQYRQVDLMSAPPEQCPLRQPVTHDEGAR